MYVTTFTGFAQNCNIGSLLALYGSTMYVVTLALSPGVIPSFAVLHTRKACFSVCNTAQLSPATFAAFRMIRFFFSA